jgi:hypothetical protein
LTFTTNRIGYYDDCGEYYNDHADYYDDRHLTNVMTMATAMLLTTMKRDECDERHYDDCAGRDAATMIAVIRR